MFVDAGLKDKIVVVTGGSRGIGKAIVNSFLAQDAIVYFFYHQNKVAADELVQTAESNGKRAYAMQVDIRDKAVVDQAINQIYEQTQRLDVLVNNSGIVRDHLLMALSEEDIKAVIDTNILGVFNVSQAVVPFMVSQRAGKIINISSVSAEKGGRGQANYAASKGAINAFTKALAVELAARKITVNAVAPGVIETDISKEVRDLAGEEILSKILLKRYGQPEEVAHTVLFLASKYADYITGEIIHVNGGFKMA